jgi:transcriptional/translational regulatory protein YebC/TACO1
MFKYIGLIEYEKPKMNFEEFFDKASDLDPLDIYDFEGDFFVETEYKDFHKIEQECSKILSQQPSSASLIWKPNDTVDTDEDKKIQLINFIEKLEELEDVVEVYSNLNFE